MIRRPNPLRFPAVLAVVWLVMLVLSYYASWLLLPDMLLMVVLAMQLHAPSQLRWAWVLPFSLLADVAAALPLGFHGLYFVSMTLLLWLPGKVWPLLADIARLLVVFVIAVLVVLLKWLMTFVLTGEPAASAWWVTVLLSVLCWPVVLWCVWLVIPEAMDEEHG